MVDGGFELFESVVIMNYLFEKYGDGLSVFLFKMIEERVKSDEWYCFILFEFDEIFFYVIWCY